ncbi:MAG: hypothetical protein AB7S92_07430 [Parvibaculaceae bacterium]
MKSLERKASNRNGPTPVLRISTQKEYRRQRINLCKDDATSAASTRIPGNKTGIGHVLTPAGRHPMAKRSITKRSSSLKAVKPAATRLFSHPLAKELIAASLVYAAASIIRGQSKRGSLSRRLVDDPGQAANALRGAAVDVTGGLGGMIRDARLAVTPALEALMRHFGEDEASSSSGAETRGSAHDTLPRAKAPRRNSMRSRPAGSRRRQRPERTAEAVPPTL